MMGRYDFAKHLVERFSTAEDSLDTTHWVHPEWIRE